MKELVPLEALFVETKVDAQALTHPSARATSRSRLVRRLAQTRAFPAGYWHAHDLESALDVMRACLDDFGIASALVPAGAIESHLEEHADDREDTLRRDTIALALRDVNRALTDEGSSFGFFAFADNPPGFETDEPVWLLLTASERTTLLELGVLETLPAPEP